MEKLNKRHFDGLFPENSSDKFFVLVKEVEVKYDDSPTEINFHLTSITEMDFERYVYLETRGKFPVVSKLY